jgi:hypothetical protein
VKRTAKSKTKGGRHENQDEREGRIQNPVTGDATEDRDQLKAHRQLVVNGFSGMKATDKNEDVMKIETHVRAGSEVKDSHDRYAN